MNILITGAAGFIGSQLAYRMWKKGENLVLVDNFSYGRQDNLIFPDHEFTNEIIVMDIRNRDGISYLVKENKIDYVYNIAGIAPLPDCQSNPQEAVEVNVVGLVNILEASRKYGVKKVIQASTNAIYENTEEFPTKETDDTLPSLIYPNTKYVAERFAQSFCDTYGMNVTCIRFSNVYGPHIDCLRQQPPFVAYMIRELYYGRTPIFHSDGTQRRDYVYIDDLLDLAIQVQESVGFDYVNAAANKNYSVNELYAIACELTGKNIAADYAVDAHYWEKYPSLFTGHYKIKKDVLSHEINKYSLCSNTLAKEKYHWEPKIDIKTGLKRVIEHEFSLLAGLEK